jgi:hypothetical protein
MKVVQFEVGGKELSRIHRVANDKKFFCYFTGFLEGIAASGYLEDGEIEPLITQCEEFVRNVSDGDANDIIQDFDADLLEHESVVTAVEVRLGDIDPECNKSATNRFLGFSAGIACDGKITEREAARLVQVAQETPIVLEDPIARNVVNLCIEALDDGIVDPQEAREICDGISRLVGDAYCDTGLSSLGSVPVFQSVELPVGESLLEGCTVVLTGAFSVSPRRILEEQLQAHGAAVGRSVTRKTDYLIVATEASRDWVHTHKGTKIIKALELRDKIGSPSFVSETVLLRHLGMA